MHICRLLAKGTIRVGASPTVTSGFAVVAEPALSPSAFAVSSSSGMRAKVVLSSSDVS